MSEYIDKNIVCYQLEKLATVDNQSRAIRRAERLVEALPASNVRPVILCKDCGHWDIGNRHLATCGHYLAKCRWFTRQGNYIETSEGDYCSYGSKWKYEKKE